MNTDHRETDTVQLLKRTLHYNLKKSRSIAWESAALEIEIVNGLECRALHLPVLEEWQGMVLKAETTLGNEMLLGSGDLSAQRALVVLRILLRNPFFEVMHLPCWTKNELVSLKRCDLILEVASSLSFSSGIQKIVTPIELPKDLWVQ